MQKYIGYLRKKDHSTQPPPKYNLPLNTPGYFIFTAMNLGKKKKSSNDKSHIMRAFAVAGSPLFFSLLIQVVIVVELYKYTRMTMRSDADKETIPHMVYLQVSCLVLWFIDMSGDLSLMLRNAMVVFAKRYTVGEDDEKSIRIPNCYRALILSLAVLTEFAVWLCVLISGTLFVIYSATVEDLILNCIAVKFITDVDEIVAQSILPAYAVEVLEDVHVHLPHAPSKSLKPHYNRLQVARSVFSHFLKIPVLVGCASFTVVLESPHFNSTAAMSESSVTTGSISVAIMILSFVCAVATVICKKSTKVVPVLSAASNRL